MGELLIPVPAQNSAIREFVLANGGTYVIPPLESAFLNCYHQLFDLLNRVEVESNIVAYTVTCMPSHGRKRLQWESIAANKKLSFSFVLENLDQVSASEVKEALEGYQLRQLCARWDLIRQHFD